MLMVSILQMTSSGKQTTNAGKDAGKEEPSYTVGENLN
jgi:hypothetical protein